MIHPTNPENSEYDPRLITAIPLEAIGAASSDVASVAGRLIHTIDERIEGNAGLVGSVATKLKRAISSRVKAITKRVDSVLANIKSRIDQTIIDNVVSIQPIREKLGLLQPGIPEQPSEPITDNPPVIIPTIVQPSEPCINNTPWPRQTLAYHFYGLNPIEFGGNSAEPRNPARTSYYFLYKCNDGQAGQWSYFAWDFVNRTPTITSWRWSGPYRWEQIPPFTGGYATCPCTGTGGGIGDDTIPSGDDTIPSGSDTIPVADSCCKVNPSSKEASPSSCFPLPQVAESDIRNVRILPWGDKRGREAWIGSECGLRALSEALAIHEPVGEWIDRITDSEWASISDDIILSAAKVGGSKSLPQSNYNPAKECELGKRQYVCSPFGE